MVADVMRRGDRVDQLVRRILRVARHKADAVVALHFIEHGEEVGEIQTFVQPFSVGIDVLAEQRDVLIALIDQTFELSKDIRTSAASLAPAHIRDNTVRAEIIASVHDRQPRAECTAARDRHALHDIRALDGRSQNPLFASELFENLLREFVDGVRPEDNVDVRIALAEFLDDRLLLRHASAHGDHQAGVLLLDGFQRTNVAEHAVLRMFPDRAGVEYHKVGILGR